MDTGHNQDLIVRADRNHVVITGIVLHEPTPNGKINTRHSKLVSALLDGFPYQFPMQSQTYTCRIIEHPGGVDSPQTNVIIPEEIRGEIGQGDNVQITARESRSLFGGGMRYVAVEPVTNSTSVVLDAEGNLVESHVAADASIPAGLIRALPLILLGAIALLVVWLSTGGLDVLAGALAAGLATLAGLAFELFGAVLIAVGPVVFICIGIYMLVKSVMPK